jgi:hypothetical protein
MTVPASPTVLDSPPELHLRGEAHTSEAYPREAPCPTCGRRSRHWPNFSVLRHEAAQRRKAARRGAAGEVAEVPAEERAGEYGRMISRPGAPVAQVPGADEADAAAEAQVEQKEDALPKPPAAPASTRGPRTKAAPDAGDGAENT